MSDDINWARILRTELFFTGDVDLQSANITDLFKLLNIADNAYYNTGEAILEDSEYDAVRLFCNLADPNNAYFVNIGSTVRTGKEKPPVPMGSLDQIYEGDYTKWVQDNSLANQLIVISEKLDGFSCLLVYDATGQLKNAFSRGNGTEGASIFRHLKLFNNLPKYNASLANQIIRGEVIFNKHDFLNVKSQIKNRGGKEYRNPRNCVSGLMNAESNDDIVYQWLHFIAYDIPTNNTLNKCEQLNFLKQAGFEIPFYNTYTGGNLTDVELTNILNDNRSRSNYEIDGIVIEVNDSKVRSLLVHTRDTLNPKYAVKFKVADVNNKAVSQVTDIILKISKDGYIKPTIVIDPVELVGVTVTKCTGFNMKYIYENKIGPGAKIHITRSGDVIPFCLGVVEPMPEENMQC
jgi:NAD-dependent DNA ligase